MIIREHIETDFLKLAELMRVADNRSEEWAHNRINSYLRKKPFQTILVAEENNQLLGYVGIKILEDENQQTRDILGEKLASLACLTWIGVHPNFRKRGIAAELLAACESWIKAFKTGIWLDCREKMLPFYEKVGYSAAGKYLDDGYDRHVLVKLI